MLGMDREGASKEVKAEMHRTCIKVHPGLLLPHVHRD